MRIVCSPTPSMSATPVQLISVSRPRDGQARFGQRCIASPSGFTISVPQSGQCVGIRNSFVPRRCGPAGPTICGMTSPARWTITSSPCADPLAVDVLLVVQRRAGDGDAADLDRLHDRPRVERAGAADADADLEQPRHRRHRRPLVGARPARARVQDAEPPLLVERVDLDHDAVDLVVELQPALLPLDAGGGDLVDRLEPLGVRVGAQAVLAQPLEHLELRLELDAFATAGSVDPDRERPVGGDRGVLLAEAARRRVARIRRELLVRPGEALVQLAEARDRQVHLAADLDQRPARRPSGAAGSP